MLFCYVLCPFPLTSQFLAKTGRWFTSKTKSERKSVTPTDTASHSATIGNDLAATPHLTVIEQRESHRDSTGDSDTAYEGVPLNSDHVTQIRILNLLPGKWEEDIISTLDTAELENQPEFEALSYCWGTLAGVQYIRVNENHLQVSPNLYGALQNLRDASTHRKLWIDTICINQDSMEGQAAQVSIMRHKFTSASTTIA